MSAEICELNGQPGRAILRLFDWDDASRQAIAQWKYDGVEPKSALGSFEPLAEFADLVHWLYYPDVESSAGLEKLKAVRRITFGGELPLPKFDLRQLPVLEVVQCDDASGLDKRHLNHPQLRYLDLEGLKAADLTFLSETKDLAAMRLRRCSLTGLKGSKALNGLKELRLLGAKKLEDVSDIGEARNLEILKLARRRSCAISAQFIRSASCATCLLKPMKRRRPTWPGSPACPDWNVPACGWRPGRLTSLSWRSTRGCMTSCSARMPVSNCPTTLR